MFIIRRAGAKVDLSFVLESRPCDEGGDAPSD
jgi:hypothetical protein